MGALVIIMVFSRPAIATSTFVLVFLGSAAEVGGGIVSQAPAILPGVSPRAGLVVAYTGLVTAVGGLVLGVLQILAANRKADALTMIQLASLKMENDRLRQQVAENKGWLVTVLNRRQGEEYGHGPTFHPDPTTATPQAMNAAMGIPDLLVPAPDVPPLPIPPATLASPASLAMANPYGPLPSGSRGDQVLDARVDAINRNTEAARDATQASVDLTGAVQDVARKLP